MMNTMFAIPADAEAKHDAEVARHREEDHDQAGDDVAGNDHRTFREPRPDQADDKATH